MSIKDDLLLELSIKRLKQLARENDVPLTKVSTTLFDFRNISRLLTDKDEIVEVLSKSKKLTVEKIKDFMGKDVKKGKTKDVGTQIKRKPLTAYEKDQILTRQKNKCGVRGCKYYFDSKVLANFDHVKSLKLGGKDEISNIQALCPNHHAEKTRKDRHLIAEKKKK